MSEHPSPDTKVGFEFDGIEATMFSSGAIEICDSVEGGVIFIAPHIARELRDWLNKVLP